MGGNRVRRGRGAAKVFCANSDSLARKLSGKCNPGETAATFWTLRFRAQSRSERKGWLDLSAIADLQREVDLRLRGGEPLEQVEHEVIEPSDLSEEDKSALWLYGWASLDDGPLRYQQRRDAVLR
jgi:hypothetical protein